MLDRHRKHSGSTGSKNSVYMPARRQYHSSEKETGLDPLRPTELVRFDRMFGSFGSEQGEPVTFGS